MEGTVDLGESMSEDLCWGARYLSKVVVEKKVVLSMHELCQ